LHFAGNTSFLFFLQSKYQTFLRTSPPYSYEALVVLHTLEVLNFREAVVVFVKDDIDALDFVITLQKNVAQFKIHVQKYIEIDMHSELNTTVEEDFEEVTSNIIVLFAKKDDAEIIFDRISVFSTLGKMCIVNELASQAKNVPNGRLIHFVRFFSSSFFLFYSFLMFLDESKIVWIGNGKKPQEITLPKHLRVVTTHDPPFVYTTPVSDSSQCSTLEFFRIGPWHPCVLNTKTTTFVYCCAGYAIDLLSNLSISEVAYHNETIHTGFTFCIHLNDSYGMVFLSDDGYTLNGMVGELEADTADLAVGGLTINPEREILERWVYFCKTICILTPIYLWGTLLASVLLVGCVIYLLDLYSPFDQFTIQTEKKTLNLSGTLFHENLHERVNFGEAMWFVWGVLLNSGVCEKTPRSCSARVLGVVWCGFCMIMVASYTANLAAFLVLDQPEKGLTGITDPRLRNPAANFTFGTVLDTNTYQYFKRHIELSTMHRNMGPHNVKTASQAIQRLLNGTLDAFIWDSTRLEYEAAKNCKLRTRGTLFGRSAYGVGLQKNSPWTPHITNAILRLSESGKMEQLHSKWVVSVQSRPCVQNEQKVPARLGLTNMRGMTYPVMGWFAYLLAFIFIILFLWPCVPIACFLPCFADYVHICPNCGHRIGRYRKGAKPRFYV
uniref:LITAF domain-containing protein n=1 Tax=Enterobius vermicularis TaxID=51028 RepID=A0A0N4UYB3_ENTVE